MPITPFSLRLRSRTALALLLLLPLLAAGCADQAPEPKPAATAGEANAPLADNGTAVNATLADNGTAANATAVFAGEANATLAGKATLAAPVPAPEAANATRAACPPLAPAKAAKSPAKPAKAVGDAAPARAKAKDKKPAALAGPLTLERAHEEFASFSRQWLVTLSRNMLGSSAHVAVTQEEGGYVARFAEVDQNSLEFEVKSTDSSACPFVGILKYFECSYEARGVSPEAAKAGSFSQVRKVRYTELFRHSGKRWE